MGKKNRNLQGEDVGPTVKNGPDGGVTFDSTDFHLDQVMANVKLDHITKVFSREAYERARPFVLEQRQKLEGLGWSNIDGQRTELFVLRRSAPHGSYTDDGFMYVRCPKKWIDFNRSGKKLKEGEQQTAAQSKARKAISKRKENAPTYEINSEHVWKIKIDGADSEDVGRDCSVMMDVVEPLENLIYLVMCLQPGMVTLQSSRKEAVQPGTKETDIREDGDYMSHRHRAQVANESYTRTLPPPFWFKRNAEVLTKILAEGYEPTLAAAEDPARSITRDIKDFKEKVWEEQVKLTEAEVKAKAKRERKLNKNKEQQEAPPSLGMDQGNQVEIAV